jgi:cytochrome c-type biogenesis protein
MESLLAALAHAIEGAPLLALGAAFAWGLASVILSPCHLASIPLIIGFLQGQGRLSGRRTLALATLFAIGVLITIGAIGAATAAAGRMLGDIGGVGNYLVALVFFVVGLHLLGVIPLPGMGGNRPAMQRRGPWAALLLGLIFGVALGPCTFAFMAPMLAVVFRLAATNVIYGAALVLAYALGHCAVIVLAGSSVGVVQRVLNWNDSSRGAAWLRRACGVLVMLAGLYMLYRA